MTLLMLVYVSIALFLIVGCIVHKNKRKKIALFLAAIWIGIPILFVGFLILFKSEIQQGKVLPQFGAILILVSPPDDLWAPLGEAKLNPDKKEYQFEISHKYVGNHVVDLSFEKLKVMERAKNDFEVELIVKHKDALIYSNKSERGASHWGKDKSGLTFIHYRVPDDLSVRTKLNTTIKIKGDIKQFIEQYGTTTLSIRKGSDL